MTGSVAEWSKALVLGTSLSGRGFESHRCQTFCRYFKYLGTMNKCKKKLLEMRGIEPLASRMRIERSTTELHPPIIKSQISFFRIYFLFVEQSTNQYKSVRKDDRDPIRMDQIEENIFFANMIPALCRIDNSNTHV